MCQNNCWNKAAGFGFTFPPCGKTYKSVKVQSEKRDWIFFHSSLLWNVAAIVPINKQKAQQTQSSTAYTYNGNMQKRRQINEQFCFFFILRRLRAKGRSKLADVGMFCFWDGTRLFSVNSVFLFLKKEGWGGVFGASSGVSSWGFVHQTGHTLPGCHLSWSCSLHLCKEGKIGSRWREKEETTWLEWIFRSSQSAEISSSIRSKGPRD